MQQELTRREALKRGAMTAGALAWATPVMQVVGISPAYAQETSPGDGEDCCIDAEGNTVKLKSLTMKYLGEDNFCDGSFTQDPSLVSCADFVDPTTGELPDELPDSVYVVVSHQEFPFTSEGAFKPGARIWFVGGPLSAGSTFTVDATNPPPPMVGEARLKGETWVHIFRPTETEGEPPFTEEFYAQKVGFHTSCSEPLFTGDIFGAVKLVGCEPEDPNATLTEPAAETQELEGTEELDQTETTQEAETPETPETTGTSEGSDESENSEKPERPEQSQAPGQSESEDGPGNSGTSQSTMPEEAERSTTSSVPEGEVSEESASD